ncbi:MAG TPA: PQQ-binding-like beta-propeller repeat protein [Enhygromyxa sp.]|nr:PQQ-binding-like beta-propeller repeat protein [Enhygromyxa sp.]
MRLLSLRSTPLMLVACGCAPHGEELQPQPLPSHGAEPITHDREQTIVEAEPPARTPTVVAPRLPELAPSRPLAQLAPLWHEYDVNRPAPRSSMAVGYSSVAIDPTAAAALGISGVPVDLEAVAPPGSTTIRWAGPMLLLSSHSGSSFTAVVPPAEVAWAASEQLTRSYIQLVSESMLVASFYGPDSDQLIGWALDDGREQWTRIGSAVAPFTRVMQLWTDDGNAYLLGDRGLLVFDPVTGIIAWDQALASPDCGVATGDGFVVIEDPGGYQLLDAATGTDKGRVPNTTAPSCRWMAYSYAGVAPGVIAEGRLFAFLGDPITVDDSPLLGFDLLTRQQLWRAEGVSDDLLVADHDAVYVASPSQRVLRALDAATGKQQAEISIGVSFQLSVEPVGGAAGPLLVVDDDDYGQWILGRTDPPPTLESYVIRGRLIPEQGLARKRVAGVRLLVGEDLVVTDKKGRFSARGTALGVIPVMPADDLYAYRDDDDWDYLHVTIDPRQVELEGKGSYELGDIVAYEVASE